MTCDDEPLIDDIELIREINRSARPVSGYWYWRDKPIGERGAADAILRTAGLTPDGLRSLDEDPPDCEATIEGLYCGIEVTELVHQKALELSIKAAKTNVPWDASTFHFQWDRVSFLEKVQKVIDSKERRAGVRREQYDRYLLVIHTDEFYLGREFVEEYLADASFYVNKITDVLLGLSYHPDPTPEQQGSCPVFRLPLTRR